MPHGVSRARRCRGSTKLRQHEQFLVDRDNRCGLDGRRQLESTHRTGTNTEAAHCLARMSYIAD